MALHSLRPTIMTSYVYNVFFLLPATQANDSLAAGAKSCHLEFLDCVTRKIMTSTKETVMLSKLGTLGCVAQAQ